MQGKERADRELLDARALVGHLVPAGSMFGFLAAHRGELFADADFADLFPRGGGGRRCQSGTLVHDAQYLIRVLGQLPPPLQTPTFSPASIRGGTSSTGTVALAGPAPAGGAVISLLNSNPSVATVPATVTIPGGQTSASFP